MEKESLIYQAEKIKQALNVISVSGYGNIKTLGNCIDALISLEKDIDSYEKDLQKMIEEQVSKFQNELTSAQLNNNIIPVDSSKPKPKRIKKEVNNSGEN